MTVNIESFFSELEQKIDVRRTAGINAVFQFNLTGPNGGDWYVQFTDGKPSVQKGLAPEPNLVLSADVQDWLDIVSGKINGQAAFLTGKLKLRGDLTLAMKLQALLG